MTSDVRPPLPVDVQIEVTGACNLRCRMCLVRYRPPLNRMAGSLSMPLFRRIVDALPGLRTLTLQGLGEPLLCPDLPAMVEYAAARGIRAGFNTNGTLLVRRTAERLVRAGLAWLHVSIDGATPETYAGIRDGAELGRVQENVRGLVDVTRRLGVGTPDTSIVFVAMRRNLAELPDVVRLTAACGVRKLRVQNLSHDFHDTAAGGDYQAIRDFTDAEMLYGEDGEPADPAVAAVFDEARRVATDVGVELRLPRLEPTVRRAEGTPGCAWPWRSLYVTYDGRVQPCCMLMGRERGVLGDLAHAGLADVWHGDAYAAFRAALAGPEPPVVCRGCALYRGVF
jgi:MoaA/NifB/PqqE/SkfB family radical SAM enzyme